MRETQTIDKVRIYAVAIYVTRDSFLLYLESSIKKKGLIRSHHSTVAYSNHIFVNQKSDLFDQTFLGFSGASFYFSMNLNT